MQKYRYYQNLDGNFVVEKRILFFFWTQLGIYLDELSAIKCIDGAKCGIKYE